MNSEMPSIPRLFGCSLETECSWPQSEAHAAFVLAFLEAEQQRDAAIIDQFLASKDR